MTKFIEKIENSYKFDIYNYQSQQINDENLKYSSMICEILKTSKNRKNK